MSTRFIRLLFSLLSVTSALTIYAGTIRGKVLDTAGEPLSDATVRVLAERDSAFVTGAAANADGVFTISNVKAGKYIVQANYIGFDPSYQNVTVKSEGTVRVQPFKLKESSIMLKETTVVGVKTPIKVMEDTVEYNADTYKTQPNAVVEDLLKRLPGVEVGSDGAITANGQTVKKILVDGKEFFSDDPAVASKNLPVNMVDKLQVVQRKSDLARMTGVDDGEDETVINLTVKKGMNNGWFGTVEGGYGTDERYKGAFVVNRFWNGNQLTVLGNANNVNDAGFTDGNGNRFRRFGGNNGINTTQSLGVNFNIGKDEIIRVGGDVMYSHNDRDTRSKSHRENLLSDMTTIEDKTSLARDKGHNVRGDFRVMWNVDSFNLLEFRPNLSININDSENIGTSGNYNSRSEQISNSRNLSNTHGTSYEFGGRLIYNHKFRNHKGRSISFYGHYQLSNVRETEYSWARNAFWQLDSLYEDYQEITDHRWTNSVNGRLSWTEPLGNPANGNFIQASYGMNYRWNNSDQLVYHDPLGQKPIPEDLKLLWSNGALWDTWGFGDRLSGWGDLTFDDRNSSQFRNEYFNQSIRIGFKKVHKLYNLDAGISVNPQMTDSRELLNPEKSMSRWVWNYAPYLRFRYKFSKQTTLNADYFGRSSQPSIKQMQPIEDSSDPLNIVQGNKNLNPSFSHNLRARFQSFNMDNQRSIMVMMDGSMTQNSIVSKVTYNRETGGRYTTYENVNGVWSVRMFSMFSQPLRNKAFTFNNFFRMAYNRNVGFTDGDRNVSGSFDLHISPGLAYRPANLELELRPRYGLQTTSNSIQQANNRVVHTYGGRFNGTLYTKIGIDLNTDLNYSQTSGYANGYDTRQWMWNAQISYSFLKGRQATLALKAYDLLQQKKNISRSVTATMISDNQYNSLTRYFMMTFTYKFTTFGKGKNPDASNSMRYGPPGGHGGRGPGFGGPPRR